MPTQRKIDSVAELTEKMSRMQAVIVADYRGITVEEITKVRNKIRPLGGEFIIA
ncbi:MAG: 50S ribosomal protein L10, partial [Chloroflexi bacterium]|nr:50S ribosomal protein L10 [Chloroflexota bacterium]